MKSETILLLGKLTKLELWERRTDGGSGLCREN